MAYSEFCVINIMKTSDLHHGEKKRRGLEMLGI
jgi:hypothetical protein